MPCPSNSLVEDYSATSNGSSTLGSTANGSSSLEDLSHKSSAPPALGVDAGNEFTGAAPPLISTCSALSNGSTCSDSFSLENN